MPHCVHGIRVLRVLLLVVVVVFLVAVVVSAHLTYSARFFWLLLCLFSGSQAQLQWPPPGTERVQQIFSQFRSGFVRRRDKMFELYCCVDVPADLRPAFNSLVESVEFEVFVRYLDGNGEFQRERAFPTQVRVRFAAAAAAAVVVEIVANGFMVGRIVPCCAWP